MYIFRGMYPLWHAFMEVYIDNTEYLDGAAPGDPIDRPSAATRLKITNWMLIALLEFRSAVTALQNERGGLKRSVRALGLLHASDVSRRVSCIG